MTRLIDRIFSAIDRNETDILDQLINDHDSALKDGEKDTVQLKYIKLPEKTVDIIDKKTGEHTYMKKSGSCMMMKSGNSHMFSIPSYRNSAISLFSADNNDDFDTFTTKAFALFDKLPTVYDIKNQQDNQEVRKEIRKLEEKGKKLDEDLLKKSRKLADGKITDAESKRLKADMEVIKVEKEMADTNKTGLESQLTRNSEAFNESLEKGAKQRYDLAKAKEIAANAKKADEQEDLEKKMLDRKNLGDQVENKMRNTTKDTFVDKKRGFSAAGYSDEREKIITLLIDLRDVKKTRHKDQILSSIDNISKKISDNKIKNLISSMITELKKLSINDSQYDQIILDTIDNMKNDGIQKLFSDRSLKAITKFYAWQDNREAYDQYVNGRRRQRLRTLGTAAALATGGALTYNYLKNNGVQPLMNTVHEGANAISRAANNGAGQWVQTGQPITATQPVVQPSTNDLLTQASAPNNSATNVGGWVTTGPGQMTNGAGDTFEFGGNGAGVGDQATVQYQAPDLSVGNLVNHYIVNPVKRGYNNTINKVKGWLDDKKADPNEITTHTEQQTGTVVDPHASPYIREDVNWNHDNDANNWAGEDSDGDGIADVMNG